MTATEVQIHLTSLRAENEAMEALLAEQKRRVTLLRQLNNMHPTKLAIIARVASVYGISAEDIFGRARPEHIAWPRQVAMALAYEVCNEGLDKIGKFFGGRDHGTVLHAIKAVKNRCSYDKKAKEVVEGLRESMKATPPSPTSSKFSENK